MKQTTKNILGVGAIILLSSGVAGLTTYKLLQSNEAAKETSFNEMFKQNPNVKLAAFDAVNAQPVDFDTGCREFTSCCRTYKVYSRS